MSTPKLNFNLIKHLLLIQISFLQVDEMIAQLSCLFQLQPGDLIMTGTPAGTVSAVQNQYHTNPPPCPNKTQDYL